LVSALPSILDSTLASILQAREQWQEA